MRDLLHPERQHEEYFGGLREAVLERDGYRCRVCDASGRDKRSIIVHHRVPGKSVLGLMLSLCPGCHAKLHRTKAVLSAMPPLLLELWREQHPKGHEQVQLDFGERKPAAQRVRLFKEPETNRPDPDSQMPGNRSRVAILGVDKQTRSSNVWLHRLEQTE